MKVLLLAAGLGTRLRPLTSSTPKCLVKINGMPLLEYWLKILDKDNFDILINTHYLSNKVRSFLSSFNLKKAHIKIVYEANLLGTAGTIRKNKNFFRSNDIMVIHADNLSLFKIDNFINLHKNRKKDIEITMMTFKTDQPENCGILEIKKNIVTNMYEKQTKFNGDIANGAVYIFSNNVLNLICKKNQNITDISTQLIPLFYNRIQCFKNNIYHRDIGNIDAYNQAQKDMLNYNAIKYFANN